MKRVLILSVFAASALAASAQSRFDLNGDSEVNVGDVTKLVNIILGIVGGAVAGALFGVIGISFGGPIGSIICGVVGACLLIFIFRLIKK